MCVYSLILPVLYIKLTYFRSFDIINYGHSLFSAFHIFFIYLSSILLLLLYTQKIMFTFVIKWYIVLYFIEYQFDNMNISESINRINSFVFTITCQRCSNKTELPDIWLKGRLVIIGNRVMFGPQTTDRMTFIAHNKGKFKMSPVIPSSVPALRLNRELSINI